MTSPAIATGGSEHLVVSVSSQGLEDALRQMPKAAYFWWRQFLFDTTVEFRKDWLRKRGTKFGRGRDGSMRVLRVNDSQAVGPRDIAFHVRPADRRATSGPQAQALIGQLQAEVFTGNVVMAVHEFGRDIQSNELMAIPIKTRPGRIAAWRARNAGASLLFLPSKRGTGEVLVYEKQHRGRFRALSARTQSRLGIGRPLAPVRVQAPAGNWQKLRLRWVLTKKVDMKPTLRLYATWDANGNARAALWRKAADGLAKDLQTRDARDLG